MNCVRRNKLTINANTVNAIVTKINEGVKWLKNTNTDYRIIIKQTANLGDTLHITPIARHYKLKYPNCKILFIVGNTYFNIHELNKDFDKIITINSKITPQERIMVGNYMKKQIKGIDKILCPSIFPFGEVWPTHRWSWPIISQQYVANAEISPREILGGGKLHVTLSNQDIEFAKNFIAKKKCIGLEYNSYSHPMPWNVRKYSKLVTILKRKGYNCISFAGKNEGIIPNTIDARGMTWRRTVAVLSLCHYMIGIGSGITMLAAAANPAPKIIEINVSDSISMKSCGYAESIVLNNAMPDDIFKIIENNKK